MVNLFEAMLEHQVKLNPGTSKHDWANLEANKLTEKFERMYLFLFDQGALRGFMEGVICRLGHSIDPESKKYVVPFCKLDTQVPGNMFAVILGLSVYDNDDQTIFYYFGTYEVILDNEIKGLTDFLKIVNSKIENALKYESK